jgi:hypothetical protein
MDRVSGSMFYSKIDLKDAYYRIRIKKGDEWKTAFRTRYGHFEFLVMPMGLTNAPATFQAYINKALQGLVDDFCIVYLDDILIFSKTREEHTEHLKQVCNRLREAELYAKPSKCVFYKQELDFLGFIIGVDGIKMDPARVQTIKEWENHPPRSFRDLQVLLGFCNFYRRFIKDYSAITRPLTQLLRGSQNGRKGGNIKVEWKEPQQQAFLTLLGAFQTAPLLRHFDPQLPLRIEADASGAALGGVLSQLCEDQKWHPIAFFSRQFKGAEVNYSTPDKEMMAIVECFKHWRHYLEGSLQTIEVWTDHQNLKTFMVQQRLNGRQARWLIHLMPYDFKIHFRPGKLNPADAPSRRPDYWVQEKAQGPEGLAETLLPTVEAKLAQQPSQQPYLGDTAHGNNSLPRVDGEEPEREILTGAIPEGQGVEPTVGLRAPLVVAQVLRAKSQTKGNGTDHPIPSVGAGSRLDVTGAKCAAEGYLGLKKQMQRKIIDSLEPQAWCLQTLSRRQAKNATHQEDPGVIEPSGQLLDLVLELQKEDPLCQRLRKEIESNNPRKEYLIDSKGLLRYQDKILIPEQKSLIQELLYLYHDDQFAGHWGIDKTKDLLQRKFYWKNLTSDVHEYIVTCPTCQNMAITRHKPYGKLQSLPIPKGPWQEVSLDFITQLPVSRNKFEEYDAILVVVDRYTKMAKFIPTNGELTAPEFAALFHKHIELSYGAPRGIVSDRDTRITAKFWAEVCSYSLIKRRMSTAFHPQTDGQTEILNRILENYLRAYTSLEQMNWAQLLPSAEFAYNNSKNTTTQTTPFMALYGYNPELRVDVEDNVIEGEIPAAKDRIQRLEELRKRLKEEYLKAQERQAKYYNQRHQEKLFKRGDLVKLSTRNLRLKDKKLQPRWVGPFRITERIGSQAYRLALPQKYSRLHDVFPVQFLEDFYARNKQDLLPMPELEDDDEWEIEEIKGKAYFDKKLHFLVKWKGWPSEYNQWIPKENMIDLGDTSHIPTIKSNKRKAKR